MFPAAAEKSERDVAYPLRMQPWILLVGSIRWLRTRAHCTYKRVEKLRLEWVTNGRSLRTGGSAFRPSPPQSLADNAASTKTYPWDGNGRTLFGAKKISYHAGCPLARIPSFGYNADFADFLPFYRPKFIPQQLTIDDHSTALFQGLIAYPSLHNNPADDAWRPATGLFLFNPGNVLKEIQNRPAKPTVLKVNKAAPTEAHKSCLDIIYYMRPSLRLVIPGQENVVTDINITITSKGERSRKLKSPQMPDNSIEVEEEEEPCPNYGTRFYTAKPNVHPRKAKNHPR
ncbi:uncharacterized protein BDR25DRAFT_357746 [Lindgomyces ingoldianus]|uniref:Uncharacterized protein n=1 Tax=Lindgomyces ingoldianus TaxID=673940 RepID=A0ACB6QNB7_9PLEO|nr:uncharacterized protein BDR25DRAFT_357746 [Lindgomyces ingoldianus]KAF2468401.1 hypothetical protein BDR25DRAFT_357746 [Lindgomyces ingoldianus]